MIQMENTGYDKESLEKALKERTVKKLNVPTSAITIYSLKPTNMPDNKEWLFTRVDSQAIERLNNNQRLYVNRVAAGSLPTWARMSVIRTGFFLSVATKEEEMQFFVERNAVSTLMKFLSLQGRAFVKSGLTRNLMLKEEMDEQDLTLSLVYREEKRVNSYGDKVTYRSIVAFRNEGFDTSHQLENLETAVNFWEQKGAVVDKWSQDQEKINVRMVLPQMGAILFQGEYSLPKQVVPCITIREGETGDAAFRMQTGVVLLAGTKETRQGAEACAIGGLASGKAKTVLRLDTDTLEGLWNEAYRQFCGFASQMREMQGKRISPAGNADDDGTWEARNMKQLRGFILSALKACDFRKAVGVKRKDVLAEKLLGALNPAKAYSAADIALLFFKIPGWIKKWQCNETVCDGASENAARIVVMKEAA